MSFALWQYPVHALAFGIGAGLAPFAQGTFGSLIGVALFWFMAPLGAAYYSALVVLLGLAGIFVCGQTARDFGEIDPGFIVFDEIVGFLVAMYLLPPKWRWIVAGLVLYRIFDIWKPYPIHLLEEGLGLGSGIVADDMFAGFYTLIILHAVRLGLQRSAH